MKIEIKTKHKLFMSAGFLIILADFIFFFNFLKDFGPSIWYFNPVLVVGILLGTFPFITDFMNETKRQKELEFKFLEFVRNLVENVRTGISIPQAIVYSARTDYGALSPYVRKIANQIEWGFPLQQALTTFANDTKNDVIKRSVAIVIEAQKSGGDIGAVLQSVTESVWEVKKIKDERKSSAYTQTIQGYIIYFFFVAIMIVMQLFLIPKLGAIGGDLGSGLGTIGVGSLGGGGGSGTAIEFAPIFIATILIQGLFAGLMLGKFAEGDFKSGVKHSLFMAIGGYLIMSTITGAATANALTLLIPYKLLKK